MCRCGCECACVCLNVCVNWLSLPQCVCVSLCVHALEFLSVAPSFKYITSVSLSSNGLLGVCYKVHVPSPTECHEASSSVPECQGIFSPANHGENLGGSLGLYLGISENL